MKRCIFALAIACIAVPAGAQIQRAFVASTGSDANPCSRMAPCRNFAAAVAAVLDGGEVVVLDSAGYGPVTITTNVSLIVPSGIYGGITAQNGVDAVTVNAPGDTVVLRGLTLNGLGSQNGVNATAAGTLRIESCEINGFNANGIQFTGDVLTVNDSVMRDEDIGISAAGSATINRTRVHTGTVGIYFQGISASVRDSVLATNLTNGWGLQCSIGSVDVKGCLITGNKIGVVSQSVVTIADSIVTANGTGLDNDSSTSKLLSFGNNELINNFTADTAGFAVTRVNLQ